MIKTRKDAPAISFSGVMTILFTLITIITTNKLDNPQVNWIKSFALIAMYFILALLTGNYGMIADMAFNMLTIEKEGDLDYIDKILLVQNQLEIYTNIFSKLFVEVKELVCGEKKINHFAQKIKTFGYRIVKGEITPLQSGWIFTYIVYTIFQQFDILTNIGLVIPFEIQILIHLGFLFGLQLTSYTISGIGKLMNELYKVTLKNANEHNAKLLMKNVIHTIKLLCLSYKAVTKKIERTTGMTFKEYMDKNVGMIEKK